MTHLNGIAPYFTMFPLDFPMSVLGRYARAGEWTLDPFCGRGTTNYAARLLDMPSVGIDSSLVAVALAGAKLANASPTSIVQAAQEIIDDITEPTAVPEGEFWTWAFHPETLQVLCRLREGLMRGCESDARKALRAVMMGALHGPRRKRSPAYFSNQAQRTYAPKPGYAVKFWKTRGLHPDPVDTIALIAERAQRYYGSEITTGRGLIAHGDSRESLTYADVRMNLINWVVTSPPYYGMRTYLPDQWLRFWFVGGPAYVDYGQHGQIDHSSRQRFVSDLHRVWKLTAEVCDYGAHLVVRFGGINDRKVVPLELLKESLGGTGWMIDKIEPAGSAAKGRRQALQFARCQAQAIEEHDVWATMRA
jgi:hypothetical protein